VLAVAAVTLSGTDVLAPQATDPASRESTLAAAPEVTSTTPLPGGVTAGTTETTDPGAPVAWPAELPPAPALGQTTAGPTAEQSAGDTAAGTSSSASASGGGGADGWLSGAAGSAAVSGAFSTWRGSPVEIMGTWSDNNEAMVNLWSLQGGGELGSWDGPVDIAIGAFGPGESWSQAAAGAYDARWRQSLTLLRDLRAGDSGTTYIRFAHEMNGNWYPWSVDSSERADFLASWHRFRALQQSIFPQAQLVFCVNRESVGSGFDWRQSYPSGEVDVLGVDYYNQYPYASTVADFQAATGLTDQWGAPKGLQGYAAFARSQGVPLAVPEWSGVADQGDSPAFIQGMHDWFAANAGSGPGQLLYEILFDIDNGAYGGNFILSTTSRLTASADAYRRLF
jgi:hypothetical protein